MIYENIMFEIVYCVSSLVGIYVLHRFMRIRFQDRRTSRAAEALSYTAYYLISTGLYLTVPVPMILLCFNIISFFLLSLNYSAGWKKRLFSVMFMYIIMLSAEVLTGVLTGFFSVEIENQVAFAPLLSIVLNHLLMLVIVELTGNIKEIRQGMDIPGLYWACLIIIPVFSVYYIVLMFQTGNVSQGNMAVCIIFFLLINIAISYIYDIVVKSMTDKAERMLLEQQNKSYKEQFEIMKTSLMATKSLRHDLKNHFIAIEHLIKKNAGAEAQQYIERLIKEKIDVGNIHSGNLAVDSILGYKLHDAEKKGIEIISNFLLPEQIPVATEDMVIILGNLLDNALEAVEKLPEEKRKITIEMKLDKGRLILGVTNSFDGMVKKSGKKYETLKANKKDHGIGLYNVNRTIEKYNGQLITEDKNYIFSAVAILFL